DPTPAPEAGSTDTPLEVYEKTGAWTQQAAADESKVLQAMDVVIGALADSIAGKRGLFFNNGDVLVQALPGDPFWVLMGKDASGNPQLQYVDPTTQQPIATLVYLGIVIAIAAGVAVVSLSAAYAIGKVSDY